MFKLTDREITGDCQFWGKAGTVNFHLESVSFQQVVFEGSISDSTLQAAFVLQQSVILDLKKKKINKMPVNEIIAYRDLPLYRTSTCVT